MKRVKYFLPVIMAAVLSLPGTGLSAQSGIRFIGSGDLSFKLGKKLEAELGQELRVADNFSSLERLETSAALSWKLSKYLKAGGGYVFIYQNRYDDGWEKRHRFYGQLTGLIKPGRFTISLRERFQSTSRVGVEATSARANPKMYLRSRAMCEYDIRKSPFSPYISAEYYLTLNDPVKNELTKIRYTIGTNFRINGKNSLNLYYRYVTEKEDDDIEGSDFIGLSYSFKIK